MSCPNAAATWYGLRTSIDRRSRSRGPAISGALFAAGFVALPLVACGLLKIAYDLALWPGMRREQLRGE